MSQREDVFDDGYGDEGYEDDDGYGGDDYEDGDE
jgi:hypothetical protein